MKAIGYEDYQGPRLTRQQQIARMHRVIENELTEKQKRAVLGYYVDKKTMPELAREFGVCKSTVCRTIQRAEKRLRRCLRYYMKFCMPSGMFVGVDAHIDPRAVTNSPKISEKTVRFAGAMWASTLRITEEFSKIR